MRARNMQGKIKDVNTQNKRVASVGNLITILTEDARYEQPKILIVNCFNYKRSAVGRGRSGWPALPRPTTLLSPSSDGKPQAATAVVAPDDGREDIRNMLSCI